METDLAVRSSHSIYRAVGNTGSRRQHVSDLNNKFTVHETPNSDKTAATFGQLLFAK